MSRSSGSKQETENQPTLRSGIYLLMVNPDIGLVIHWPEIGCYEDNASSQKKKNMTNLHRYLTKLTDQQICFMSEKDLENFNWGMENDEQDSDDEENNMCYEFEVKKSQEEQEDFKLHPGFTINLLSNVKKELENKIDNSLTPMVVESAYNQTFITRKKITSAFTMKRLTPTIHKSSFKKEFQTRAQGYAIEIDRRMKMKALEFLIKNGLDQEKELLSPLRDAIDVAKKDNDLKKEIEKNAIKTDAEHVTAMSREKVRELYGEFELRFNKTSIEAPNVQIEDSIVERINAKYPDMQQKITRVTKINSNTWKKLKTRYFFARLITTQAYKANTDTTDENKIEIGQSTLKLLYSIFMDEETDMHKVVKKYTDKKYSEAQTGFINIFTSFTSLFYSNSNSNIDSRRIDDSLKEADEFTKRTSDTTFIQTLYKKTPNEEIRQGIIDAFFREYSKWRKDTFIADVKGILPKSSGQLGKDIDRKLDEELTLLKRELEDREFEKICKKIEENYSTGRKLKIIDIIESYYYTSFHFTYEIETTQPDQLQITIYETSLEQSDAFEVQENELHVPRPRLFTNPYGQAGTSFHINPDVYEMSGVLNVYAFDEGYTNLFPRNSNVQILQWYNSKAPDIQHFFFIKDTEELCFVEVGGRARIYNLVNGQFRPGIGQVPANATNVMSTPDGACIVAFVKETLQVEQPLKNDDEEEEEDSSDINDDVNETTSTPKVEEKYFAYIYFCTSFGKPNANKVIEMPPNMQSFEYHQFSFINKRQIHITTLDIENGSFCSSIVKITLEKTQYRFQQRSQKRSLGQARLSTSRNKNFSIVEGKNTNFTRDVREGEIFVLSGEKHNVLEIISDTKLKISKSSQPANNEWSEFRIEPKTNLNGLIDAYRMMFEKYPVDNSIDIEQTRPLTLQIALDTQDDDKVEDYKDKFEDYVAEMFEELKRSTKKPATSLKKFTVTATNFNDFNVVDSKFQRKNTTEYQLGEWIIQLSVLIPIQIAVARNNMFTPLRDGLSSEVEHADLEDGYARHVDAIAQNISFGWYEGIFKHFGNRQVKVVSSMGEQSCGKSYMLNHLVGTTFDGSAMRCTEGVWMSLVITKQYLYVALDFEGLKSLERTPQEGIDMSTMFQRFQDGATFFESDPKIFQAKLCIIIKDVPRQDREDIVREFSLKFNTLVAEEGEDNFITRMYPSGLNITPWPIFNDSAWFKSLKDLKKLLDKQKPKYENARIFLQNTKVIMAKLKICDWGSLDENLVQIRVATLKRLLPIAVAFGVEQKDQVIEHLLNRDTGHCITDPTVPISDIFEDLDNTASLLPDAEILLFDESKDFIQLSDYLRAYFEENIQQRKEAQNDSIWFNHLGKFFKYIVERRVLRVQEWFTQNTDKFPQDNSDVVIGRYAVEQEMNKLTILWTLCGLTCNDCNLKCLENRDHEGGHNCLTDHTCHTTCQFTEAHIDKNHIPLCSHKAGHEGKHACSQISHLCGKPCRFSDKRNCQKRCSKEIGHEDDDEDHLCQSPRHYCGAPCSLVTNTSKGDYNCPNKCIIPCEEQHDSHRCENETCPIPCPMKDCQRRCKSDDHFHAYSGISVNHFCGNEHQCQESCEDPGLCKVQTEPKKQEEVYKGLVENTSITFIKYIQVSERLQCSRKIPPGSFSHTGKHSHDPNGEGVHYCDKKCSFCEYYCTLPYGHIQTLHETRHGNMIQTEFTAEDNEFEYGGHRHIDYCQNPDACKFSTNQNQDIQHIDGRVHPNPDESKDFISHRLFWERTGFKDPYTAQEQQEFSRCDHECKDEKHHKSQNPNGPPPSKSYCELQLFHAPVDPSQNPPNGYGYVSLDGHHFNCENPSTREAAFHIIFVLDRSGSMNERDRRPLQNTPIYNTLTQTHNNRLGAVYNAVHSFLTTRFTTQNALSTTLNTVAASRDTISLVLFDHEVVVGIENEPLSNHNSFINTMLQYNARGGTDFNKAIQKAGFLIEKHFDPTKTSVVIFCSDGECGIPDGQLNHICSKNKERGSPIFLQTILFSSNSMSPSLQKMADIAQKYLPQQTSSGSLKCQFTRAIDEVNLVNTFTGVAESLRKHKPALLRKNI
ncbi:13962_t:CDS:10 [Dentiscutata erythropus]|uniref:13962_t:CDS:1 n=1 Tax=Dentiscutata erythropus TaxID=1348616 RepID=A0A9N8WT39_9GLOM|nr:13962_t:CDS:10 [Dentiscutata erythropus]